MCNYILQISLYDTLSDKPDKIDVLFVKFDNEPSLARIHSIFCKYFQDLRYGYSLSLHYAPYNLNSLILFSNEVNHAFLDRKDVVIYDSYHIYTKDFPASDGLFKELGY